jgi:hypothetical protein
MSRVAEQWYFILVLTLVLKMLVLTLLIYRVQIMDGSKF